MKIQIENVRSAITEFPPSPWDRSLLKEFTRKAKDSFWMAKHHKGWTGATCFISEKKGLFPTGILPLILEWAKKNEIEVEITDLRQKPAALGEAPHENMLKGVVLRDYQLEAIQACLKGERGLVKASTGSGKSFTIIGILKSLGLKSLIIVDKTDLMKQLYRGAVKHGFKKSDVGMIGDKFVIKGKLITIATVQSAHKLEDLSLYQAVCCDESQHSKSKTYIDLMKNLPNAYYRFGFSGTVFGGDPLDDMYRISQFGNVLYEIGTQELIAEGVLSKPTIRFIEINQPDLTYFKGQYIDVYKAGIANNNTRNSIIARLGGQLKGKVLILFKLIEHGQTLKGLLPRALYADGSTPSDERTKILAAFNKASEGVLLASAILDEGIDIANVHSLILGSGDKSLIKTIQRLGRGLRANDYMQINVIDFMDNTHEMLKKHSKERMKIYISEGHTVKIFET